MLFRRKQRPLGERGERLAVKTLKREGYTILGKNLQLGRYEVDILAQEGDTVVFVEVKSRRSDDLAAPEANVSYKKQQHLSRAARWYLKDHEDPDLYYRFDVLGIVFPERGKPEVTIFRNAFQMLDH